MGGKEFIPYRCSSWGAVTTTKGVSHPAPLLTVASAKPRLPSRTVASAKSASHTATLIYLLEIYSPFGVSNLHCLDSVTNFTLIRFKSHASARSSTHVARK